MLFTMLGANLSDLIPGGPSLTLTLSLNSNWEFSRIKPDTDIVPKIFPVYMVWQVICIFWTEEAADTDMQIKNRLREN